MHSQGLLSTVHKQIKINLLREKLSYWLVWKSLFWLFREEQDSEYARRIQEEIQRAAEEERRRQEEDEVWQILHLPVYCQCVSYLSGRFHTAFHLNLAHIAQGFYTRFPNHWLIQGLSNIHLQISILFVPLTLFAEQRILTAATPQPIVPQGFYLISLFFMIPSKIDTKPQSLMIDNAHV